MCRMTPASDQNQSKTFKAITWFTTIAVVRELLIWLQKSAALAQLVFLETKIIHYSESYHDRLFLLLGIHYDTHGFFQ
jgi:hypothetical protein